MEDEVGTDGTNESPADESVEASVDESVEASVDASGAPPPPDEADEPDAEFARIVASGPVRLVFALIVVTVLALWLARDLRVASTEVPAAPAIDSTFGGDFAARFASGGDQFTAVIHTDTLTPDVVNLIEHITDKAGAIANVAHVSSVTNTEVIRKHPPFTPVPTPAFGSGSTLDLPLPERVTRAASSPLETSNLISSDGRTLLVTGEMQPGHSRADTQAATDRFRQIVDAEVAASPQPVTAQFAGNGFTDLAATESLRTDLLGLTAIATILPAAIALIAVRRRVPTTALLLAGSAALLLASVFVSNVAPEADTSASALAPDHPIALGNRAVDEQVHGTIPIEIDLIGTPGDFHQPEVLARMDALANWLHDEYGIRVTGLSTLVRDAAGVVSGVDSIPPNPVDTDQLLTEITNYRGGAFVAPYVTADFSRSRLIGYAPDRGAPTLEELAHRFDRISTSVFVGTGVAARFTATMPSVHKATADLATDLAIIGFVLLALAILSAVSATWARHHIEEAEAAKRRRRALEPIDLRDPDSLFSRTTEANR